MSVKEKLVELLDNAIIDSDDNYGFPNTKQVAEHLITNGVTVQEWISVKDSPPDNNEYDWVLAQIVEDNGFIHIPKVMEYRQQKMTGLKNHMAGFLSTMGYLLSLIGCPCLSRRRKNEMQRMRCRYVFG